MEQQLPNFTEQLEYLKTELKDLPQGFAINQFLSWIYQQITHKPELFLTKYQPIIEQENNDTSKRPFLSVIVRTQGKRLEPLREALLCLTGQEDTEFEVILIGHKVNEQQENSIRQIISEQTPEMQRIIRFFTLSDGTRTTPLNLGFAHARGEYAAILDDDDIVFDSWVDEFHKAATKYPGKLIHAYVLAQKWMLIDAELCGKACRATAAPTIEFCSDFDLLTQTIWNKSPLIGIAFPLFLFRKLGLIFDEALTTTEDWDYIMRCAFLSGVADIQEPTSIYRLWENAEVSYTLHPQEEWQENYSLIRNKILHLPMLIPAGIEKSVALESINRIVSQQKCSSRLPALDFAALYYRCNEVFSENSVLRERVLFDGSRFDVIFKFKDVISPLQIRFDLTEEGVFTLENVSCIVTYANGQNETLDQTTATHNGFGIQNEVFFAQDDPWVIWSLSGHAPVSSVKITGSISCKITSKMISKISRSHVRIQSDGIPFWKKTRFWELMRRIKRRIINKRINRKKNRRIKGKIA